MSNYHDWIAELGIKEKKLDEKKQQTTYKINMWLLISVNGYESAKIETIYRISISLTPCPMPVFIVMETYQLPLRCC